MTAQRFAMKARIRDEKRKDREFLIAQAAQDELRAEAMRQRMREELRDIEDRRYEQRYGER